MEMGGLPPSFLSFFLPFLPRPSLPPAWGGEAGAGLVWGVAWAGLLEKVGEDSGVSEVVLPLISVLVLWLMR